MTSAKAARISSHWHVAGASVCGGSHQKNGQPCQDAHAWRELPGGGLVLAVADGAGSAQLSQIGAARAAISAVDWISELMAEQQPSTDDEWHELLLASIRTAHESVLQAAANRQVSPREMATTLILLVALPGVAVAAQVGDGAAVVMLDAQNLVAITAPQSGEYINETAFFTSPNYLEVVQFGIRRGRVQGIAAFSDGLQLLALHLPEATPHKAFFTPFFTMVSDNEDTWETQQQLQRFLRSDRIKERADDDLTLVVATLHHIVQHTKQ